MTLTTTTPYYCTQRTLNPVMRANAPDTVLPNPNWKCISIAFSEFGVLLLQYAPSEACYLKRTIRIAHSRSGQKDDVVAGAKDCPLLTTETTHVIASSPFTAIIRKANGNRKSASALPHNKDLPY